ncbi:MAG TPA: ABC transporter ATP-binding protein [Oceanicaulis sp.]|jgi:phospholipid/cholesterol/gamma-HCH transport system ATP-binding protein|uniref:ABC transporter ATP-binding protein n=1 Tax=Glycocaulis albus TaxID=1382801 RepID=A0ABQ1XSR8_9PROT|nr:ABC transporter ATP-binding protein [Glycocaulis albus]MBV5259431.1 ABC transporter ATP-binding protein [Synechococcus moorigangaii CMS01]GGH01925.1 ABC transporter ATP-binding protein [Glycocaulis albus]HCY54893.1 ABC transporter ATP-binding protein [Oceanicaulis sp.]
MSTRPLIEVRGLVTRFGSHVVHDGLDLEVRRGEVMGIVGGSGSGKSVLLHTILGLKAPDGGEIFFDGRPLSRMTAAERAALERRWGVLFQGSALFSSLTVRENILVPIREHVSLPPALMDEIADLKLGLAGLGTDAINKYPSELSGGMKKRAGLARALALDPDVLFLDEPTAGLDPISAAAFDELIRELCETLGLTILLVTHDLDTLHAVCDRVAVIAEKRIIAVDTIARLATNSHPWIQDYFGGPRGRAALRS